MSPELQQIFLDEYRVVRPRAPMPALHVRFRRFTTLNTTIRLREGCLHVSLSDILEGAPEPVLRAIAHILIAKLYRKPLDARHTRRYRVFSSSESVMRQSELDPADARPQNHSWRRKASTTIWTRSSKA